MSGTDLLKLLLAAGTAVSCTLLIRGKSPALAMAVSAAAVLALFGMLFPRLQAIWLEIQRILTQTSLQNSLIMPLVKVTGITQISHLSAELCRDAGEKAIAAKVELCGAASSVLCVLPLAQRALELIGAIGT